MEGSATSFRLQNLSKFEKQLNILRSVLQENSKYHICTQSDEITVPTVPEFLLGPASTSKSSEFSNANEAKLLRLSTINSALTCLELAEKICQCGNENDELARDEKSHYYMETKLGIFLTDYHVTMCILDSLICRGKFIVHTASNTFLKYCLKFPETLLKHDLLSKNISRMCLDNRAMFMDLLALLTKVLRKQIKQKDDKFLFSVTETHQSYFDILSVLIRNFCDFVLDNSTVNKHLGLNSSFKMLTEIEIYSKWKSCFQILKLCNLMTCIFSKHSSSLESPYAGEREQCIENELSGKCYNLFLEVERACSHFTNLEVISAISISNYSCKYALKILKLNLEDTQNSNKSFETATLIMDFFLESDTEQLFQFKQANSNEKNTYSSIFKSEIKDENFVSGMMSRFRMWLIILLRSCLLVADAACDQYHHKVIESLKRLSTYLSSSYFDEKQDADTVLNMDRSLLNVFIDEDDQLFEAMMYLFKIYNALLHRNHTNLRCGCREIFQEIICPHRLFYCFLNEISFDHMVCIDWLISDETCFDKVLILYLDIATSDFKSFLAAMRRIDYQLPGSNEISSVPIGNFDFSEDAAFSNYHYSNADARTFSGRSNTINNANADAISITYVTDDCDTKPCTIINADGNTDFNTNSSSNANASNNHNTCFNTQTNTVINANGNTDFNTNSSSNANASNNHNTCFNIQANTIINANGNTDFNTNSSSNANASNNHNTCFNTQTNTVINANGNTDFNTNSSSDANVSNNHNTCLKTQTNTMINANSNTGFNTNSSSDANANSNHKTCFNTSYNSNDNSTTYADAYSSINAYSNANSNDNSNNASINAIANYDTQTNTVIDANGNTGFNTNAISNANGNSNRNTCANSNANSNNTSINVIANYDTQTNTVIDANGTTGFNTNASSNSNGNSNHITCANTSYNSNDNSYSSGKANSNRNAYFNAKVDISIITSNNARSNASTLAAANDNAKVNANTNANDNTKINACFSININNDCSTADAATDANSYTSTCSNIRCNTDSDTETNTIRGNNIHFRGSNTYFCTEFCHADAANIEPNSTNTLIIGLTSDSPNNSDMFVTDCQCLEATRCICGIQKGDIDDVPMRNIDECDGSFPVFRRIGLVDYDDSDSDTTSEITTPTLTSDPMKKNYKSSSSDSNIEEEYEGLNSQMFVDSFEEPSTSQTLAAEQIMAVFIKLRLKLERFAEKYLSQKQFQPVIYRLDQIEDLYDADVG